MAYFLGHPQKHWCLLLRSLDGVPVGGVGVGEIGMRTPEVDYHKDQPLDYGQRIHDVQTCVEASNLLTCEMRQTKETGSVSPSLFSPPSQWRSGNVAVVVVKRKIQFLRDDSEARQSLTIEGICREEESIHEA